MYTLKQVCQMLNLSEHTVRYYTDIGVITVQRDQNNRRIFDEQAIDWLRGTCYLRSLGMSIQDIKTFHELCMQEGDEAIKQRLDILLKQKENAEKELKIAKKRIEFLNHKIEKEKRFFLICFQMIRILVKRNILKNDISFFITTSLPFQPLMDLLGFQSLLVDGLILLNHSFLVQ